MTTEKVLSKDDLLGLTEPLKEPVTIPGVGVTYVRGMSGSERDAWEASLLRGRGTNQRMDLANMRARLAVRCLTDEAGVRLFADSDAERVGRIRADVLQRIFDTAQKLNGISNGDLDELGKSSASVAGDASSST